MTVPYDMVKHRKSKPIREYLHNKEAMIEQMFSSIPILELKNMVPIKLQGMPLHELKAECILELLGMSDKDIINILDGNKKVYQSSSESEVEDILVISDDDNRNEKRKPYKEKDKCKIPRSSSEVQNDTRKRKIRSDAGNRTVKASSSKQTSLSMDVSSSRQKSSKVDTNKRENVEIIILEDDDDVENSTKEDPKSNYEEKSLLDLLELEMRARAIRSLLKKEDEARAQKVLNEYKDEPDDLIPVIEEPPRIEILSDTEDDENDRGPVADERFSVDRIEELDRLLGLKENSTEIITLDDSPVRNNCSAADSSKFHAALNATPKLNSKSNLKNPTKSSTLGESIICRKQIDPTEILKHTHKLVLIELATNDVTFELKCQDNVDTKHNTNTERLDPENDQDIVSPFDEEALDYDDVSSELPEIRNIECKSATVENKIINGTNVCRTSELSKSDISDSVDEPSVNELNTIVDKLEQEQEKSCCSPKSNFSEPSTSKIFNSTVTLEIGPINKLVPNCDCVRESCEENDTSSPACAEEDTSQCVEGTNDHSDEELVQKDRSENNQCEVVSKGVDSSDNNQASKNVIDEASDGSKLSLKSKSAQRVKRRRKLSKMPTVDVEVIEIDSDDANINWTTRWLDSENVQRVMKTSKLFTVARQKLKRKLKEAEIPIEITPSAEVPCLIGSVEEYHRLMKQGKIDIPMKAPVEKSQDSHQIESSTTVELVKTLDTSHIQLINPLNEPQSSVNISIENSEHDQSHSEDQIIADPISSNTAHDQKDDKLASTIRGFYETLDNKVIISSALAKLTVEEQPPKNDAMSDKTEGLKVSDTSVDKLSPSLPDDTTNDKESCNDLSVPNSDPNSETVANVNSSTSVNVNGASDDPYYNWVTQGTYGSLNYGYNAELASQNPAATYRKWEEYYRHMMEACQLNAMRASINTNSESSDARNYSWVFDRTKEQDKGEFSNRDETLEVSNVDQTNNQKYRYGLRGVLKEHFIPSATSKDSGKTEDEEMTK